uniref:Variant surface glycoprotein n=1 Tax=Trypanosoma congolense (strain IL3000) TaxID=1068625 RepID=F9WGW4_TRYCI|nr:Variant surface glycoprotein [Trypanosoma congolense IL3000]
MERGKMRNWNRIVAVWWVIVAVVGSEHYNKKEFEHLCKILKVAEGEPKKIPDELRKFTDTTRVLESLLRVTRTSTATYQKVVKLSSIDKEDADFVSYTVKRKTANAKIQHAWEKVDEIISRMEEELILANKERTQARNSLAHAIYGAQVGELPKDEEIPMVLKNVSRGSISNSNGGEKKVKYHGSSTNPTCGGSGESGAGFTLINDFYCLCAGKESNHTVCHQDIRGPAKWNDEKKDDTIEEEFECKSCNGNCNNCPCCGGKCRQEDGKCKFYCDKGKCDKDCKQCKEKCCCCKDCDGGCNCGQECKDGCCRAGPYGILEGEWLKLNITEKGESKTVEFEKGWPHIRKVCEEVFKDKINTTAESIQEVLDEFNKLLGGNTKKEIEPKSAEMDARRLFVLGFVKNMGSGCKGVHKHNQQGDVGVCVNYWAVSNLGIGIVWQNYMLEAQKQLQAMDKHIQKAQQLSRMIQKLKESAEESYRNSAHEGMLWPLQDGSRKNTSHNFLIFFACLF